MLGSQIGKIVDLKFLKNENIGSTSLDRKAIFDLYCKTKMRKIYNRIAKNEAIFF